MESFVGTDGAGSFILNGRPYFLHGATYFGRRPGTCGADWMGEHFAFNARFLERDFALMRELGLNTIGLFIPSGAFFDGLEPVCERFGRLSAVFDAMGRADIRAVVFAFRGYGRDAWCAANGVDPEAGFWHPAVNPHAERMQVESAAAVRRPFADRPEVLGWATGVGRFFRYGFSAPPVREAWAEWLERRFGGDFDRARELLALEDGEDAWGEVRMPTEMEPYFNEANPRSFEFAVMQQVLCRRSADRIIAALRPVTPDHLMVEAMEGCCFSSGHLTAVVPEMMSADALWLECYHWEGLRSYHMGDGPPKWMKEPVAEKPAVEIVNAAGYVQMLVRWMERSGKPIIICHGVDIAEQKRGVRSEEDQALLLDHYNVFARAAGAHGSNYWCWSDDEQSKTFTRLQGFEYTVDTPAGEKSYQQSGETMGIVRYDGTPRPVAGRIREFSGRVEGAARVVTPPEALVLFPCPIFQGLHRYRSNLTGFALFTSLAREGILAHALMSSAGEEVIGPEGLAPYRLAIVGMAQYTRDHPEVPDLLLRYVEGGGALLLPLGRPDALQDPYLKWRASPALLRLSGCEGAGEREPCARLDGIASAHEAFDPAATASWELEMDEEALLTRVAPAQGAQVLVRAGETPLLYRHRLGEGTVYVFTWNLDVLLYRGAEIDYPGGHWDWLWRGLAAELGLSRDLANPMTRLVRETTL